MNAVSLITQPQMRALWASAKSRGLDEAALRDLVQAETGARSISRLSTGEAARVLGRIGARSESAGRASPAPTKMRPRAARGLPGLRTAAQADVIRQLGRRLGWDQPAVDRMLKAAPSSGSASAEIEAMKSMLMRDHDLAARARAALNSGREWSVPEFRVLDAVAGAAGRGRNRLAVGAVLWVDDLV